MTVIVLSTLLFVSFGVIAGLIYALVRSLNRIQEHVEREITLIEAIYDALDVINVSDSELSRAATADVLYDDPTVRKIVSSMKASKVAIESIKDLLSSLIDEGQEDLQDADNAKTERSILRKQT